MTSSLSDMEMASSSSDSGAEDSPDDRSFSERAAEAVGGAVLEAVETAKVGVSADRWAETFRIARDELGLVFFSWLSAIHWANDPQVGDALSQEVTERFELLCAVSDVTAGDLVVFSTDLPATDPTVESLVGGLPGRQLARAGVPGDVRDHFLGPSSSREPLPSQRLCGEPLAQVIRPAQPGSEALAGRRGRGRHAHRCRGRWLR